MVSHVKKASYRIVDFHELVSGEDEPFETIVRNYQRKTLWTYAVNCILGIWLITNPFIFNYKSTALAASDAIAGALLILVECVSLSPRRYAARWLIPVIALWLLFAPLIFWSPTPAVYLTDTLIACLVITFSFLIPGAPGQGGIEKNGPDQPPGWSYNPSSWIRRWLGIALALLGFFISRYLAACQLGYVSHAWDPFFGTSSDRVLHSTVSRAFPISDAGFGGIAYILEVMAGFLGDRARWRTSPWVVTTFAILVVPLGVTSIVLVMLQPTVVGAWCGLCLIAAAGLLISVPLAVHEIIAMGQFMRDSLQRGKKFWSIFWMGGTVLGAGANDPDRSDYSPNQWWVASVQGVTVPWQIAAQILAGTWLMARPDIFQFSKASADCDHLLGALAVTVAAIASAEVTRTARFIHLLIAVLLVAAAVIFARNNSIVFWSDIVCALILAGTCWAKGHIAERYADWNNRIK